jgi:hypothetical protein
MINSHQTQCLTQASLASMLLSSCSSKDGSRNPFLPGEKSPQPLAAFLCTSFSAVLCRVCSIMAGLFGQRSALAAPGSGFRPHLSPPPDSVETITGGYSTLPGATAMTNQQTTGQIRPIAPLALSSAHSEAYNAVIDAFDNGLKKSFDLLIRDLEPIEIVSVDCVCVLMDCERLIERLKLFKALTAEIDNFGEKVSGQKEVAHG